MALNKVQLDGNNWRMNYFRPRYHFDPKQEFDIHNMLLPDGEAAGACQVSCDTSSWWKVTVPGDVHTGLMENGKMEDPFCGRNSDRARWVENYEWWFRRKVEIPASWHNRRIDLVFEGVDYLATYYWDGEKLGTSSDMFVPVRFDLHDGGRPGEHVLAVRIAPPPQSTANHFFNGQIPERARHHKMQCSWGWDWTREINNIGIWDHVRLEACGPVRISDAFLQGRPIEGTSRASMRGEIQAEGSTHSEVTFEIIIFDPDERKVYQTTLHARSDSEGTFQATFETVLDNARLWWPNGYGDQPLYRAEVRAISNGELSDRQEIIFGIRKIEMQANTDASAEAYDLTFVVNGVKIFAAGANWVPADMLPGRLTAQHYEKLISLARQAGFTLLRNWGGGLIEKDEFYQCCDRYGFLVWQEFPLSCANYPKDTVYLEAKRNEAQAVIRKLRHHPCLAMWCGGNEMQYYGMSPAHPVFDVFREEVERFCPDLAFHVSSPDKSRPGERDHGPWAYKGHSFWNSHFRNFMSEFGCNSLPSMHSLQKFIPDNELPPASLSGAHHFINMDLFKGYEGLQQFEPETLSEMIFYSQLAQADTLQYVMGLTRSRQFQTSGCLVWQFNSAWPEGGWGLVDYYGEPRMALYWLSAICRPQGIVLTDRGWEIPEGQNLEFEIHGINGLSKPLKGQVTVEIWAQKGKKIYKKNFALTIAGESAIKTAQITLPAATLEKDLYLVRATLTNEAGNESCFDRLYACGSWKDICRQIVPSQVQMNQMENGKVEVTNFGNTLTLMVELRSGGAVFSDNFFNLLPGQSRTIYTETDIKDIDLFVWNQRNMHSKASLKIKTTTLKSRFQISDLCDRSPAG